MFRIATHPHSTARPDLTTASSRHLTLPTTPPWRPTHSGVRTVGQVDPTFNRIQSDPIQSRNHGGNKILAQELRSGAVCCARYDNIRTLRILTPKTALSTLNHSEQQANPTVPPGYLFRARPKTSQYLQGHRLCTVWKGKGVIPECKTEIDGSDIHDRLGCHKIKKGSDADPIVPKPNTRGIRGVAPTKSTFKPSKEQRETCRTRTTHISRTASARQAPRLR